MKLVAKAQTGPINDTHQDGVKRNLNFDDANATSEEKTADGQ